MYEVFDHTADLGIRIRAPDFAALLRDAARGLMAILVVNLEAVRPVRCRQLQIAGSDPDLLLLDWLSELLYVFDADQLLLCEFDIQMRPDGFQATCRGETVDHRRHQLDHEVKAITYHGLTVAQQPDGGWLAEVIVDI